MIRVVVTVLLAVAILAAALPAVEHAAADRSESQLRSAIEDVDAAAAELAESEETVPGTAGARRTVTVTLPADGFAAAGAERFAIDGTNRSYWFRVEGRPERERRGTTPVGTLDGEPLVLREPGTHELVLALVTVEGDRRVIIARMRAVRNGVLEDYRDDAEATTASDARAVADSPDAEVQGR